MRLLGLLAAAVLAFAGCSEDSEDGHSHDQPAECEAISDACHGLDDGTPGPVHDCHVLGHDGTAEACAAEQAECSAICAAARDGGSDAATADAQAHD